MSSLRTVFAETTDDFILIGRVPADKMKLFIDVERKPQSKATTREDILLVLKKHIDPESINIGVVDDIVRLLNSGEEKVEERRIAVGRQPHPGADGKLLVLKKQYTGEVEVAVDENDTADFAMLHLFDNVRRGDIVGRLYPPRDGANGLDVLGTVIKAPAGKPYQLRLDKSLSLEPPSEPGKTYQAIVAHDDGYLVEKDGKLAVQTELRIKGDLDYRYGSINFIGSVLVRGDVLPDFNITANKGIEIRGSVRGGSLVCTDGNIQVKGHVYGGKNSRIICGKSFQAAVVQEVNAEILGDIVIEKEARDSYLRSWTSVLISEGLLLGGKTYVVCGLEAKYIGSEAEAATDIYLCTEAEATLEYGKLCADIKDHEKVIQMIKLHLGPYCEKSVRIQLLKGAFREKMDKLYRKLEQVERSLSGLLQRKAEFIESSRQSETQRINCLEKLYPGVVVRAKDAEFSPTEPLEGPFTLQYQDQKEELKVGELQPLVCAFRQ